MKLWDVESEEYVTVGSAAGGTSMYVTFLDKKGLSDNYRSVTLWKPEFLLHGSSITVTGYVAIENNKYQLRGFEFKTNKPRSKNKGKNK